MTTKLDSSLDMVALSNVAAVLSEKDEMKSVNESLIELPQTAKRWHPYDLRLVICIFFGKDIET